MLSKYKQTREQQTQSLTKIEAKRNTLMAKVKSLTKLVDDTYQNSTDSSLNNTFGSIVGTVEGVGNQAKSVDIKKLKNSMSTAKNWELFLDAKKQYEAFRDKIDAVSVFLHMVIRN